MPPTRRARYCCRWLKESGGDGRMTVTGVRWAESINRRRSQGEVVIQSGGAITEYDSDSFREDPRHGGLILTNDNEESRQLVEQCYKRHKTTVNPIIDWTDKEVWDFIRGEGIPYCSLYDQGHHRLGCIGCPMQGKRGREHGFLIWPKYKNAYLLAFGKMLDARAARSDLKENKRMGKTAQDVFNWWMEYDVLPGQITFDDYEEDFDVE